MTKEFTEDVAKKILEDVQDGGTLTTICSKHAMPSRSDVYAWLRDGKAFVDGRSFREAYAKAEEDRRMTWRDMAILTITQFQTTGEEERSEATWRLNLAQKKASMLMSASKETGIEIITKGGTGGGDAPLVIIRKFLSEDELKEDG